MKTKTQKSARSRKRAGKWDPFEGPAVALDSMPPLPKYVYVKPPTMTVVYWECHQVSYGHYSPKVGDVVGFCEHAMQSVAAGKVPKISRFIRARVTKIDGALMTLEYEYEPGAKKTGALGTTCGVREYAKYLVLADGDPNTGQPRS